MSGPSDEPEGQPPSLQVEAIIRELMKSFREELEPIHDRLERLEGSQTNTPEEDHAENGSDHTPNQRQNPRQGRVKENLEKRTRQYETRANKGKKRVPFDVGDWVWVHFQKERFPAQQSSKLLPRGDGPFQIVEKVNDNTCKLDLPGEYTVSATFNISDLTPFYDSADLRSNPFQEGGDDVSTSAPAPIVDPEVLPQGPITRSKAKQFREALFLTCAKLSDSFDITCALEHNCVNVLHTDVEIKGHDIRDLSLARLKFRS
ncbi:hypothetical protein GQ457_01G020180 [Hibiscus cannabinus]